MVWGALHVLPVPGDVLHYHPGGILLQENYCRVSQHVPSGNLMGISAWPPLALQAVAFDSRQVVN